MAKQLVTPVQKRFSDVDSFMHVNNIWQQSYFDMGKTDFYTKVLGITGVFDSCVSLPRQHILITMVRCA